METSKLNGGTATGSTSQQAQVQGTGPGAGVLQTQILTDVRAPGRQSTTTAGGNTAFLTGGNGASAGTAQQAASATTNENGGTGLYHGNSAVSSEGPAGTSVSFNLGQQNVH